MSNVDIDRIKESLQVIEQCLQGSRPLTFDQLSREVAVDFPDVDRLEIVYILTRLKEICSLQSFTVSQLQAIAHLWFRAYTNGVIDGQRLACSKTTVNGRTKRASK